MKLIPLTQGQAAKVDDEDFGLLSLHKWHAANLGGNFYAATKINRVRILMHRFLLRVPRGVEVDHADLDGLNNQRSNIRIATRSENNCNKPLQKNNTTGFKGVLSVYGRWRARIQIDRKTIHLGYFSTKEDAILAREKATIEYHKNFSRVC